MTPEVKKIQLDTVESKGLCYIPRRYVFLFLGFFCYFNTFAIRVSLSMTMVAMVNSSMIPHSNDTQALSECLDIYQERESEAAHAKKTATPWKAICTSVPVWAAVIANLASEFGDVLFIAEMPTYLNSVLRFNMLHDGLLMALGCTMEVVFAWFASFIADFMRKMNRMSISNIRKLFTSVGLFGPAACMLGVIFSGCHLQLIIVLIILSRGLSSFLYPGACTTPVDLSPAFVGAIKAIMCSFDCLCGTVALSVIGAIVINSTSVAQWNCVFYIAVAIHVLAGLFFIAFSSAELQPWGRGDIYSSNNEMSSTGNPSNGGDILKLQSSASVTEK